MKLWTIGKRTGLGFAVVIFVSAIAGGFSYWRMAEIDRNANRLTGDAIPGFVMATTVRGMVKDNFLNVYEHILSETLEEKKTLESEMKATSAKLTEIYAAQEKMNTSARDREIFKKVMDARVAYTSLRSDIVLPLSREMKRTEAEAAAHGQLRPVYEHYMTVLNELSADKKADADNASGEIQDSVHSAIYGGLLGVSAALVVSILMAWLITRRTNRALTAVVTGLETGATQVASAAGQVSSSSQALAEGASEQAASLEETSASLEEMASMTKRNAENAQSAKDLTTQTLGVAQTGATDMTAMSAAMTEIKSASDNIAKIIKTIDEIAFQTNILALNAAVEAARAGEAGAGFAVVADEVRNLAQRSAHAARETADKIEDCIRKSEVGVGISAKVSLSLGEIVSKARQVDELVAEIATASREQSQGIDQVNTAVAQMDKVTQNNAASAEESASASEELNAQAQSLKEAVADLETLVGSKSEAYKSSVKENGPEVMRSTVKPTLFAPLTHHTNGHRNSPAALKARAAIPLEDGFQDF